MKLSIDKSRSLSLDCVRIVAVLAITMIHLSATYLKYDVGSPTFLWGNIFDGLSRVGVPLFVMVSGALMLDEKKEISNEKLIRKYVLNIVLLYVSWSFVYMIYSSVDIVMKGQSLTIVDAIKLLVKGRYHMWYLIMILGLYLILPILKLFVNKENSEKVAYLILLSLLFVFFPTLLRGLAKFNGAFENLSELLAHFEYGFIGVFPTYFITGWYVNHVGIKYKKTIYLLAVISALAIILLVQLTGSYNNIYANSNVLVYLYSLGIFTFVNDVCRNKVSTKGIEKLSNLTFGVYIIHIMVLEKIDMFFGNVDNVLISIIIRFGLVITISFIVSYIISRIPVLRKLVRF